MPRDRFCSEIHALRPVRALKGIGCKSLEPSLTPIMRVRVHGSYSVFLTSKGVQPTTASQL